MKAKKAIQKEVTMRFRTDKDTARIIRSRAEFFFEGNLSELIRYALLNFRLPKKESK